MTNTVENIEHLGVVDRIEGDKVWVNIKTASACGSCQSKTYCGIAEMSEKVVETYSPSHLKTFEIGQEVYVVLRKSLGYRALMLGYLFPFLLIMVVLVAVLAITGNQLFAALASVLAIGPYYMLLYFHRKRIRATFRFFIKD